MNAQFLIALILVLLIVYFLTRSVYSTEKEGFEVNTTAPSLDDYGVAKRQEYIDIGKKRYNRFADPQDAFRPGISGNLPPAKIKQLDKALKDAIVSLDLLPESPDIAKTGLAAVKTNVQESIPPESSILREARKCEALKTRSSCSVLRNPEYSKCGVCIKGGTDVFETNPNKHIGGMLSLKMDREMAEQLANDSKTAPIYQPTVGSCPEGHFFVDADECEKQVNRLNCKESGETGGFKGGVTIEGKSVVKETCAMCPTAGNTTFIYEPKTRDYKIRLRAITPLGTGRNIIRISGYDKSSNTNDILLGQGRANGGEEIVIDLTGTVYEGQPLKFQVIQEFPHRPRGRQEVFYVDRIDQELRADSQVVKEKASMYPGWGEYGYGLTSNMADSLCKRMGAEMATKDDLMNYYQNGGQSCSWGHTKNGVYLAMQGGEIHNWCGSGNGLSEWTDVVNKFAGGWCKGIKPPTGDYSYLGNGITMSTRVSNFFNTLGVSGVPSQADQPNQKSQYGSDYEAPNYRGVILQWEMIAANTKLRRLPIEPSIMSVMGQDPSTTTSDGFKIFKILRRQGTFNSSQMIISPRPSQIPNIIPNQYWIWSNQKKNMEFYFSCKVPGIFSQPHYPEDIAICPRGPIVGEESTLDLLKVSPCLKDGQAPGKYDNDCLVVLFRSAGGDPYNGKLSPLLSQKSRDTLLYDEAKNPREQDAILEYLYNLYSIASSGRDNSGNLVGGTDKRKRREIINNAGQALFGIDIVSPCEEVTEDNGGNILLVSKTAPFDADCLDYLYTNAGKDDLMTVSTGGSGIRATYQNIMDRFSGLRKAEKDKEKDKYPFQTCQRSGTMAPIDEKGNMNIKMVNKVNSLALASNGSISKIQEYYNEFYQIANKSLDSDANVSKEEIEKQQDAIAKCYGITKAVVKTQTTGCGVMARYVRVLRAITGTRANNANDVVIQIPQLEVFDGMGNEIAKGKQTSAASVWYGNAPPNKAVDGNPRPRQHPDEYHDDGSNDDASQFWMVDLGDVFEIRKVKYYNRTDCCGNRAVDMPIQLLDADKKVVAQKCLTDDAMNKQMETIEFGKDDVTPQIPIGNIKPGMTLRIKTSVSTNRYIIMGDTSSASTGPMDNFNQAQYMNTAAFAVRPPLNGMPGAVSFEFIQTPGKFLYHYPGANLRCYINDASWTPKSASWVIRPALNGAPGFVSFESCETPGMFMVIWPRWVGGVFVERMASNRKPLDLARASWRLERLQPSVNENPAFVKMRQGRCPTGMYEYGAYAGGFCCPTAPINYREDVDDYDNCPTLSMNGNRLCALASNQNKQGLPTC